MVATFYFFETRYFHIVDSGLELGGGTHPDLESLIPLCYPHEGIIGAIKPGKY